jgi:hypothetical protein
MGKFTVEDTEILAPAAPDTQTTFRSYAARLTPPKRRALKSILGVKNVDAPISQAECVKAHADAFKGAR